MPDMKNLPAGGVGWNIGGPHGYVVYYVPGTGAMPIPLAWHINKAEDLASIFGPDVPWHVERTISDADFAAMGGIKVGVLGDIANTDTDVLDGLVQRFAREASIKPYLRDRTVLASIAEAAIEGRAWDAETDLPLTDYWRTRTPGQREWDLLAASDPMAATQRMDTGIQKVRELLASRGVGDPEEGLVQRLGHDWIEGDWTEQQLVDVIRRGTDPYTPGAMTFQQQLTGGWHGQFQGRDYLVFGGRHYEATDAAQVDELRRLWGTPGNTRGVSDIAHLGAPAGQTFGQLMAVEAGDEYLQRTYVDPTTLGEEERVRGLLHQWVGPYYAKHWSPQWVEQWAGRIRNGAEGEADVLTDYLRAQALALWQDEVPYEDRVAIWRGMWERFAGSAPNEASEVAFQEVVKANDAGWAEQRLRLLGRERNWAPVRDEFLSASRQALGGQVLPGVAA